MASKDPSKLSADERGELCCSYAALMLHDDGLEISVSIIIKPFLNVFIFCIGRQIGRRHQEVRKHC